MLTLGDSPTHSRGHTKGTASFPEPGSMQGGTGKGCLALCQSLFPLQHLQWGVSRAPQGRAGQARGAGSHCHLPIPYLCSKGHSSILGNCSHSLQEGD